MPKTFKEALLIALERTGVSVNKIHRETGVSLDVLKSLKHDRAQSTNVEDAVRIAHYFGQTLDEFLEDATIAKDAEIMSLWTQLTDDERAFLRNAAEAQIAFRDRTQE